MQRELVTLADTATAGKSLTQVLTPKTRQNKETALSKCKTLDYTVYLSHSLIQKLTDSLHCII